MYKNCNRKRIKQASFTERLMTSGKPHFNPDFRLLGPYFWFQVIEVLLDVRHCPKLQSCVISGKTNDANLREW